ncbi:MAG: carboxypeptidase regulatory-like domain-containing protein [Myxococcales bacterium]|nr:carboxypeptidase regulatory-like domain-containing protein [Myxococcales bacterium]
MNRRTIAALGLGALAVACATGAIGDAPDVRRPPAELPTRIDAATPGGDAEIGGIVRDEGDELLGGAWVTIGCACLEAPLELASDGGGAFRARGLPPGSYTITVRHGRGERSYMVDLPAGRRFRLKARISDRPTIIT